MRKLASIRKISNLSPIEDRDRIELAFIDGWQVIVQKNEYKIGDLCIYIEIDSVLPQKPEFEFLEKRKYKIKTMKMAGVLSQGICFPLSILPLGNYKEGDDVTNIIGVKHIDEINPPKMSTPKKPKNPIIQFLSKFWLFRKIYYRNHKNERRAWPNFVTKTDEERIQNLSKIFQQKDINYEVREKLDGSSLTAFIEVKEKKLPKFIKYIYKILNKSLLEFDFGVCSRNLRKFNQNENFWIVVKKYNLEEVLKTYTLDKINYGNLYNILEEGHSIFTYVQGELIGEGIQGNKYKLKGHDLYLFNLVNGDTKTGTMKTETQYAIPILKAYNPEIKWCPLVVKNYTLPETIDELCDFVTEKSLLNPNVLREGCVFRHYNNNISFKCISPKFLLKYDI